MPQIIICFSGGMDSTTLLRLVMEDVSQKIKAVAFTYGSKHNQYENKAAERICRDYNIPFSLINLESIMGTFHSDLLLTGGAIPEGHYEEENMKQTVVPARNLIFISILTGIACAEEAEDLYIGIHSGDHAIYPDCRSGFFHSMADAVSKGTDNKIVLHAPFLSETKTTILKRGLTLDVPYHLTRTCYKDQPIACGKCGACQERLEAFANINIKDPIEYETRKIKGGS